MKSIIRNTAVRLITAMVFLLFVACQNKQPAEPLNERELAYKYFQNDTTWYLRSIPFFECSDKEIEAVYYYRWKLYKAHIRHVAKDGYVITEFINHVAWDRDPFCTINAASMHHIYEGRWLADQRYMDGYINYLCRESGNNRRYSESVGDAAYARYLVNADSAFLIDQLDSLVNTFNQWQDHWDSSKQLYYIPAMPDATEYTIASIDASGGKDGFEGGDAFRPTINSYMYANAMAISKIAAMKGDRALSDEYGRKAAALKANIHQSLWNDSLQHFTDRFKVNNQYVKYWNFIRGRELAGMVPWYFNLPYDSSRYNEAWKHVTGTNHLLGPYGFRTNEPSYEYYFKQYVYYQGQRGSQWNGPSWPYQNSQALTGMANLLNNYHQNIIGGSDYIKALKLFTRQHYLPDGKINLVENYDPDKGGPIVYYYWSNHYNHSSYNNLIITGLCGIRPSEGDTLTIYPLVDSSIQYFCLQNVYYHGRRLTVLYDRDGNRYKAGKGITVLVDGKKTESIIHEGRVQVPTGAAVVKPYEKERENFALNINGKRYPQPSASVNTAPDSLNQAIDGRIWYFTEITNRWTTKGSTSGNDWFAVSFGEPRDISQIRLYSFVDNKEFALPDSIRIEYENTGHWRPLELINPGIKLSANTVNTINLKKVSATAVRLHFRHPGKQVGIGELELY